MTTPQTLPTIDLAAFDALAASPGVTVLDFTAKWCGPCRTLTPILTDLATRYPAVRVVAVDVDDEPALAQRFSVRAMPTLVLWRDGREVGRVVGARPARFVTGVVERALAGDTAIAAP
jgi:thioredoxin 1